MGKGFEFVNNHGFLYKNKYQEHNKQPSMQGKAKIDNKDYKVKAWTKTDKNGDKYLSYCFEPIEQESVLPKNPRDLLKNSGFIPTAHENDLDESINHEQEF